MPAEFRAARTALEPWLREPAKVTILPGNHDRYTLEHIETGGSSSIFGEFSPAPAYPWLRYPRLRDGDPGPRPDPSQSDGPREAAGSANLQRAKELLATSGRTIKRLIVACHYPLDAPAALSSRPGAARTRSIAEPLSRWLSTIGPHLYCCGHVHAAWAFAPDGDPRPALPERGRSAAAGSDRPSPAGLPRDHAASKRCERQPPRLADERLADGPTSSCTVVLLRDVAVSCVTVCFR